MVRFHRLSQIFQPLVVVPKKAEMKKSDITSNSQKLMLDLGLIKQASPGCFHLLPLAIKALDKLTHLVDYELGKIGAQKILFPTLTHSTLWETTGRLETVSSELFQIQDRHEQGYILSPTHEEAAAHLVATISPVSHKQLPLKLYQISNKYRDEMKPRFGLMRAKQFLMKDLYSFDTNLKNAKKTYDEVCECYNKIFTKIGVDFVKIEGCTGQMGGHTSHEYHYKAKIGEDKILNCLKCSYSGNVEISGSENKCPRCHENCVEISSGIEVGHTFLLGDKYSKSLKATFLGENGKTDFIQMGSYGLGLTRILAAQIEVLSKELEIRWAPALAPFNVIILPPKSGSKEESHLGDSSVVENLYNRLENDLSLENNVLIDDRINFTIGRRLMEAKRMGYPFIICLGKKITEKIPLFEVFQTKSEQQFYLNENDLLSYMKNFS